MKRSWPNLRYCPAIGLEGLSETTKNLGIPVSESRFESGTSRLQSRSVNHSSTTFNDFSTSCAVRLEESTNRGRELKGRVC
jgi:hypothetical protein